MLRHFAGVITPDFSTYQDFPEPLKLYNTYRMRAFGYWLGRNGIAVINNVRWGTPEPFRYSFEGIPKRSMHKKTKIKVDDFEQRLIVRAFVEWRNILQREEAPTEDIDDILLKII